MSRGPPPLHSLPEGSGVSVVPDGGNSRDRESVVKHLVAGYFLVSSPLFRLVAWVSGAVNRVAIKVLVYTRKPVVNLALVSSLLSYQVSEAVSIPRLLCCSIRQMAFGCSLCSLFHTGLY